MREKSPGVGTEHTRELLGDELHENEGNSILCGRERVSKIKFPQKCKMLLS
jgi:hypothetical protein